MSVRHSIRDRWECFFFYQLYFKFWFLCLVTKTEQNRHFVNVLLSTEEKNVKVLPQMKVESCHDY